MKVRVRLDEQAHRLIGRTVRLDGRPIGRFAGAEMEFDVDRGWHLLEVLDMRHQTRPLRFLVRPSQDVEAEVRSTPPRYFDHSWFELVAA